MESNLIEALNLTQNLENICKVNDILLKRYKARIEELLIKVKELEIQLAEALK